MAIKIDAETMRAEAVKIRGFKQQHSDAITQLRNTVNSLVNTDAFDGVTATKYRTQFEGLSGTFSQFEELLEGLAQSLEATAAKFEATDNS